MLHVPDCPSLEQARHRLREALDVSGVDASICEIEVVTPERATDVGMRGSPTILINGRDCFATGVEPPSMSCRLYPAGDRFDGAPSVAQLIEALAG